MTMLLLNDTIDYLLKLFVNTLHQCEATWLDKSYNII